MVGSSKTASINLMAKILDPDSFFFCVKDGWQRNRELAMIYSIDFHACQSIMCPQELTKGLPVARYDGAWEGKNYPK